MRWANAVAAFSVTKPHVLNSYPTSAEVEQFLKEQNDEWFTNSLPKIANLLDEIDFSALWPDFHPFPFALYNQEEVVIDNEKDP